MHEFVCLLVCACVCVTFACVCTPWVRLCVSACATDIVNECVFVWLRVRIGVCAFVFLCACACTLRKGGIHVYA